MNPKLRAKEATTTTKAVGKPLALILFDLFIIKNQWRSNPRSIFIILCLYSCILSIYTNEYIKPYFGPLV